VAKYRGTRIPLARLLLWALLLAGVAGGVLWALSPLGVYLSEVRYKTPNVFWRLFFSAPLLMLVGLLGLHLAREGRRWWAGTAGLAACALALVLVLAGNVGQFWLRLDEEYILSAPAYTTFRAGLTLLAVCSLVLALACLRDGSLPRWGTAPFLVASAGLLPAVMRDLGATGATLWVFYGAAWAWLGLATLVGGFLARRRKKGAGG
jgi:hypothetical protein